MVKCELDERSVKLMDSIGEECDDSLVGEFDKGLAASMFVTGLVNIPRKDLILLLKPHIFEIYEAFLRNEAFLRSRKDA